MRRTPGYLSSRLIVGLAALVLALAPQAASALGLIRDAEIERTLERMARPVFQAAGVGAESVDIFIVNDGDLNAFVAGGSNIFLFSGLLMELETPEELISVIAHETGHLAGGHQARRGMAMRSARAPALLGVLAGLAAALAGGPEAGAAIAAGSQSAVQRSLLAYSRTEEASADQAAIDYMLRAGVDPKGLLEVMSRFRGQEMLSVGNVDPYVLTHPLSGERIRLMERRVAEARGRSFPPDPERAYWHGRMRAKLAGFLRNPRRVLEDTRGEETEEALYARAVALYRLPDREAALDTVDRLIAQRPQDPFYIELKGQILFETGQPREAVPLYREAARLVPGEEPLLLAGLGRALLEVGTPEADAEALEVLKKARSRDLGDAAALRALATAYSRDGQDGMAALATAERYALTGQTEDAKLIAERAVAMLPEGSPGWRRAQDILALDTENDN